MPEYAHNGLSTTKQEDEGRGLSCIMVRLTSESCKGGPKGPWLPVTIPPPQLLPKAEPMLHSGGVSHVLCNWMKFKGTESLQLWNSRKRSQHEVEGRKEPMEQARFPPSGIPLLYALGHITKDLCASVPSSIKQREPMGSQLG